MAFGMKKETTAVASLKYAAKIFDAFWLITFVCDEKMMPSEFLNI